MTCNFQISNGQKQKSITAMEDTCLQDRKETQELSKENDQEDVSIIFNFVLFDLILYNPSTIFQL